jgi:hypothetical protein
MGLCEQDLHNALFAIDDTLGCLDTTLEALSALQRSIGTLQNYFEQMI